MARVYGYMDDETGVFTPVGGGQSGNAYGGNGYAPRRVGYGVESMYNPNASYSFPRNNVNAQYGPWYGRQSYATRAPYAPNQPYYERVTGSNGRPVTMRFGEYQREQPVAYETMFNSQGVPVRVPVYASGAPQQVQPQQSRQQVRSQPRRNTSVLNRNVRANQEITDGTGAVIVNHNNLPVRNITQSYYDPMANIDEGINSLAINRYSSRGVDPSGNMQLYRSGNSQVNPPQMEPADDPMKKAYHRVFGDDLTDINTERFYRWLGREVQDPKKIRDILSGEVKLDQDVLDSFKYTPGERFLRAFTLGKMEDLENIPFEGVE